MVATLVGATRRFVLTPRRARSGENRSLDVGHGSLLMIVPVRPSIEATEGARTGTPAPVTDGIPYTRRMEREDLRHWIENYRAAQRRERAETEAAGPEAPTAIPHALAVIALGGRIIPRTPAADPVDSRDDDRARAAWDRLRTVLRQRDRSR
jgi:hypothetical protein